MKWFWRWVSRKIDTAYNYGHISPPKVARDEGIGKDARRTIQADSVVFRMYQSAGGRIVEVTHDTLGDPVFPMSSLYIIRDEDDLGESLKRILTVEALKN